MFLDTKALLQQYLSYFKYKIQLLAKYEIIIQGTLVLNHKISPKFELAKAFWICMTQSADIFYS